MMKHLSLFFYFLLCSCSVKGLIHELENEYIPFTDFSPDTKSADLDYSDFLVTEGDLIAYKKYHEMNITRDNGGITDIRPIKNKGEIICYIICFDRGWELLSADKRGPMILAYSDDGQFNLEDIPSYSSWLQVLASDIEYRWYNPQEYYSSLSDDSLIKEEHSLNKWKVINSDVEYINNNAINTKSHPGLIIEDPPGHYELFRVYQGDYVCDSIPHLMGTAWHQDTPYNSFIPLKPGSITERCPAGCTTIATAQVLNYLHYRLGVPSESPMDGYCIGDSNNFVMNFYNYSDITWDSFDSPTDSLQYLPKFIGSISQLLFTEYGPDGSGAWTTDIVNSVLPFYGMTATLYNGFDSDIIYNSLRSRIPVIVSAYRFENLFNWPGHTFVVDGYAETKKEEYYVYHWVYDLPPSPDGNQFIIPLPPDDYTEIHYTDYSPSYYKINWGYGGYYNNGQYALSGVWTCPGDSTPYMHNRKMVYGFRSL